MVCWKVVVFVLPIGIRLREFTYYLSNFLL